MAFLDNIQKPSEGGSGSGDYMRLEQGENKFRVIGSADDTPNPGFIQGMLGWTIDAEGKKKPIRWKLDADQPDHEYRENPRQFWAFLVWNYSADRLQVLELTQKGLQSDLYGLISDDEWGDPRAYDISIVRNGEGKETRYVMTPKPKKKFKEGVPHGPDLPHSNAEVRLEELFTGGHPFKPEGGEPPASAPEQPAKDPF